MLTALETLRNMRLDLGCSSVSLQNEPPPAVATLPPSAPPSAPPGPAVPAPEVMTGTAPDEPPPAVAAQPPSAPRGPAEPKQRTHFEEEFGTLSRKFDSVIRSMNIAGIAAVFAIIALAPDGDNSNSSHGVRPSKELK